jgi:ubiquinol-cytochrome c reductase cytochrome b subunit
LTPSFDLTIGHYTLVPNPFWGGALFPLVVMAFLYLWPAMERKATGDYAYHNVLERPRDAPWRTAIGLGFASWVFLIFVAGSSDRVDVLFNLSYQAQIHVYWVLVWVVPVVVGAIAYRVCKELQAGERVEHQREHAKRAAKAEA